MSKSNKIYSIVLAIASLLCFNSASAQNPNSQSVEFMCKSKAKEIAAETYKNCVTEIKQSQVKSLRKEYEEKLSHLKKHYEKELKKIAQGQNPTMKQPNSAGANRNEVNEDVQIQLKDSDNLERTNAKEKSEKFIKRSSGARELPAQVENNTDGSTVEVVEIPAEQE